MTPTEQLLLLFGYPPDTTAIVPPFCLEVVLRDGRSYPVHSLAYYDESSGDIVLRIWDLRALTPSDRTALMAKLNQTFSSEALADHQAIHPKLDWGILRTNADEIRYHVEWANRHWSVELEQTRDKIGFRLPGGSSS